MNRTRDDDDRGRGREREGRGRGRDDDEDRGRGRTRGSEREGRGRGRDDDDDDRDRGSSRGRGASSSYVYQERTPEQARSRAAKGAQDFDRIFTEGVTGFKVNDGDNRIRIVPPTWKNPEHFGYDIHVHYAVGPDRQTYLCPKKMKGELCPICEEREKARADSDPDDKDDQKYLKDLEPKRRVVYYLIDRDAEKEGLQVWAAPWTVDRDIVKVSVDKSSGEVLPIDHPEDGYDVEFEKKGQKDRTEYLGVAIARRSSPLGKASWLDQAMEAPIPTILNYYDYEHIAKAFGGGSGRGRGRDDDDDRDRDRGRGRDSERGRGRDDDGDDRDRGRGRTREIDKDDVPDRGRDAGSGGRRGREPEPEHTWEGIHAMTGSELDDLVENENLEINPDEAKDDEELADWICEDLKISKPTSRARVRTTSRDDPDDVSDKLAKMRQRIRD